MTAFLQKLYFQQVKFRVDFKVCLMIYKWINNQAPRYPKCMLIRENTDSDKRTKQDCDRTGLRVPPVENLKYKCRKLQVCCPSCME